MHNNKKALIFLLLGLFARCNIAHAMELSSEFYHENSEMSVLMRAIEKKEDDVSEEELRNLEQKNSKIKPVNNFLCSHKNCAFATNHKNRIDKHREMHRWQTVLPHITMYRCDICDYLDNVKRNMDEHKNSHDGTKKYHCEVCDIWFKTYKSKQRHERETLKHQENSKKERL